MAQSPTETVQIGLYPVQRTPKGFVLLSSVANRGEKSPKGTSLLVFGSSWRKAANLTLKGQGQPEDMTLGFAKGFTVPTSLEWALMGSAKQTTRQQAEGRVAGWKADRRELAALRLVLKDANALLKSFGR